MMTVTTHFLKGNIMEHIEHNGRNYTVEVNYDDAMGAPWLEHDGHGIVSEWTPSDKQPGEWVLAEDRRSKRFYDFAATMKLAKKEGWGLNDDALAKLEQKLGRKATKGEITAESVRRDFEFLRGWCNDDWHWVYVMVTDDETGESDSLGGIESGDEYLQEAIMDMIVNFECQHKEAEKQARIARRFNDAMECGV